MCELCENKKKLGEICLNCHRQKIQEAKKELSDELMPYLDLGYKEEAMKIIKRHLSAFQKKSDKNKCPD